MLQLTTPLALREGLGVSPLNSLSPLSLSLERAGVRMTSSNGWYSAFSPEMLIVGFVSSGLCFR